MITETILMAGTLVGYSVALTATATVTRKQCAKKAAKNIEKKVAALPENHSDEDVQKIIKNENIKCTAKSSVISAVAGVGLGAVAAGVIVNADNIIGTKSTPEIETKPEPTAVSVTTSYSDGTSVTEMLGDATITTF